MDVENILVPVNEDICAMTHIGATGIEYICVLKPHKKVYANRADGGIYRHYMVNRWPYRDREDSKLM